MAAPRICSVDDCDKIATKRDWCGMHYARWLRYGTLERTRKRNICTIDGCDAFVYGHGYCSKHYQRWVRNGDPIAGRIENGLARQWVEDALTFDGDECLPWPYASNPGGYGVINSGDGSNQIVSRMICERAHGPAPSPDHDAAHSCNFRLCGNKHHLSWKTRAGNMADAVEAGTWLHGEAHPFAILTESDVKEIRRLRGKMLQSDLADRYAVSRSAISSVQRRVRWGWLD